MSGIYGFWDKIKGYFAYIGRFTMRDRIMTHYYPSKYEEQQFNRVLQNNPERYEYRILMEGDYNDWQLNQMEKLCIKSFKTFKYDYPEKSVFNFDKGGGGTSGYKHSDETKKKISEGREGITFSDEHRQKLSESHKGKPGYWDGKTRSVESIKKMSESLCISQNSSGYYRVSKQNSKRYKQGFRWVYKYRLNGKRKTISSTDIKKLEEKVKAKGLPWRRL